MEKIDNLYGLDGRVALGKAIPFGFQHVLAMFVPNITPIIILAGVVGLDEELASCLVQNCLIIAGIGTMIQLYPVWKVGSRLPIVMGISFTFLSLAITIATSQGMGSLIGAVIVGGIVEGLLGLFAKYWMKVITPIVAATVVIGIGFSLLPVAVNSFGGGQGAADFGSAENWIVGSVTLVSCMCFQVYAKGYFKALSVLFGLIVGYILAACMGMVHLSFEGTAVVALPTFMPFKPEFHVSAIISIICIFLVSATETIGDVSAMTNSALGREPKTVELSGAIGCDGFVSSLAGCLGCTPITSFSQNVGLLAMTGVTNRFAIASGAGIMILAGFLPVVGVVLTSIPHAVFGGCTIIMFSYIIYAGFGMISKCGFSSRNMKVACLSLSVGLGFSQVPAVFDIFPDVVKGVFAENSVAIIFIMAVILNFVFREKKV